MLELPLDPMLVGTVARLDPVKRLDVLLRATALLNDVHTVIAGDGPERDRLEALSKQLGLVERIHFVGQQNNVPEWLAALDIFALTSDWEGIPNAVLEAMAAGLPIVATAVDGNAEAVTAGVNGLLTPPGDPQALAEALLRLLDDPSLAERMSEAGRARAAEFGARKMVSDIAALYETLLRGRPLLS